MDFRIKYLWNIYMYLFLFTVSSAWKPGIAILLTKPQRCFRKVWYFNVWCFVCFCFQMFYCTVQKVLLLVAFSTYVRIEFQSSCAFSHVWVQDSIVIQRSVENQIDLRATWTCISPRRVQRTRKSSKPGDCAVCKL